MRYIIIGYGNIGKKRHQILAENCVATVDPNNPEADFRKIDDIPPDQYDAAVLSVPENIKIDLLSQLLSLGKHTIVEKPLLFPNAEIADAVKEISRRNQSIWYTSYNHRFEPHIATISKLMHENTIGTLYHAHLLYGNGTVRNSMGTWREEGFGVLEDLGCHLIDLTDFLFSYKESDYDMLCAQKMESKTYDHCIFNTKDQKILLECASTMWKNRFTIDIYGETGSIHMKGLCKWGGSELQIHKRVLPSGRPFESSELTDQADPTWKLDIEEFENRIKQNATSFESDLRISNSIHQLAHQAYNLVL